MRILENKLRADGDATTTLERGPTENLLAYEDAGYYKVGHVILPGYCLSSVQRVYWDVEAQEWKVTR